MLQKLLDYFKAPAKRPYALSENDLRDLLQFRHSESFKILCRFLDAYTAYQADIMLSTDEDAQLQYMRGFINALRTLPSVVDHLAKEKSDARQRSAGNTAGTSPALYGTSAWKS